MATPVTDGAPVQQDLITQPSRGLTKKQIAARIFVGISLAAIVGGAIALHFGHPAGGFALFFGIIGTITSFDMNAMANKAAEAARQVALRQFCDELLEANG